MARYEGGIQRRAREGRYRARYEREIQGEIRRGDTEGRETEGRCGGGIYWLRHRRAVNTLRRFSSTAIHCSRTTNASWWGAWRSSTY